MEYPKDKYEYIPCDLCGDDNYKVIMVGRDWYNGLPGEFRIVKCNTCGLVYTNPRPYGKELQKFYPDNAGYFFDFPKSQPVTDWMELKREVIKKICLREYYDYFPKEQRNMFYKILLFPLYIIRRRERLIQGFPRYKENGTILDVGCSVGSYIHSLKNIGWHVKGIEQNNKAANWGKDNLELDIEVNNFDQFQTDARYNIIYFRMSLEHLSSPAGALKKAHDLLKKDGELIIIVPDFSGFEFFLYKSYCYGLHAPNHFYFFTPQTIRKYLDKLGFQIHSIIHHNFDRDMVASAYYLAQDGKYTWLSPLLHNTIVRKTMVRCFINVLSLLGKTSRMTIVAKKQ